MMSRLSASLSTYFVYSMTNIVLGLMLLSFFDQINSEADLSSSKILTNESLTNNFNKISSNQSINFTDCGESLDHFFAITSSFFIGFDQVFRS